VQLSDNLGRGGAIRKWRLKQLRAGLGHHGVALRRDGPRFARLAALFADRWQAVYPGFAPADYLSRRSD
jgi:hypothetical protein